MSFDIALHPDGELVAVTILVRPQAEALPYEIAINSPARAVDVSEVKIGEGDTAVDRREHLPAAQDREVIGDQFRSGNFVQGNCVSSLQVGAEDELTDKSRREGRVHSDRIVVAAGLDFAEEALRVGAEAAAAEQEAFLLGEIAECREGQDMFIGETISDLAGVIRRGDLVAHILAECLSQEVILASLRVESAEEPELIFLDRPAQIEAAVEFRKPVRRGAGFREELGLSRELLWVAVEEGVAVKLVAAALGDDVEEAAGSLADIGSVSACLDLDLLHELKRQIRARPAEARVGDGDAVKDVVIFRAGGTAHRRVTITPRRVAQSRARNGRRDCV